jgi:tRNA (adenine37-N6)-methyltransferase
MGTSTAERGRVKAMATARSCRRLPRGLQILGTIRTPFQAVAGTPIQAVYGQGVEGEVVLEPRYAEALADLEGFERLWLVYWMERAGPYRPRVIPYRDVQEHGLFATRSPVRPNPIGLSVVRLLSRDGCRLRVADLDVLDGTPLLDLKPYVPAFDAHPGARAGWFDARPEARETADERFHEAH